MNNPSKEFYKYKKVINSNAFSLKLYLVAVRHDAANGMNAEIHQIL